MQCLFYISMGKTLNALNALCSYYGLICLSAGYIEYNIIYVFTEFVF